MLGLAVEVAMSADYPGTLPGKTTVPPPQLVAQGFSSTPTAPRCLPSCMLRETVPCPEPFRGNLSSVVVGDGGFYVVFVGSVATFFPY